MPSLLSLPCELLDLILAFAFEDTGTSFDASGSVNGRTRASQIAPFCFLSRCLLPCLQRQLYRDVCISNLSTFHLIFNIVTSKPALASCVRNLVVVDIFKRPQGGPNPFDPQEQKFETRLSELLAALPGLQRCVLSEVPLAPAHCEKLRSAAISDVLLKFKHRSEEEAQEMLEHLMARSSRCISLVRLDVRLRRRLLRLSTALQTRPLI